MIAAMYITLTYNELKMMVNESGDDGEEQDVEEEEEQEEEEDEQQQQQQQWVVEIEGTHFITTII